MRIVKLLSVFVVAWAAATGSLQADPPRQMIAEADQAAWTAVGRLNVAGQGFCTGTLVGPDIVLTAAHCVVDRRKGAPVAPDRVHFLAGFRKGDYAAHRQGVRVHIMPGYHRSARNVAGDLALVRLDRPLPEALPPLPVHTGAQAGVPVTLASYGIDRAQILSVEDGCRMTERVGAILFTDCDGVPGVSGAPLLQSIDGRRVVTAVASAVRGAKKTGVPRGAVLASEATLARMALLWRDAPGEIDLAMVPPDLNLLNPPREISSER
jgi:protease YdgD